MTSILIYKTRLGLDTLSNYLTSILICKTDLELDTPTRYSLGAIASPNSNKL